MIKINCKPISINEAWKGRRYKTKKYKMYEKILFFSLPKLKIPDGEIKISFVFGFSNKNSDLDNPVKMILDIFQKKYDFNDSRIYAISLKKEVVKKGNEFIKFKIEKYDKSD